MEEEVVALIVRVDENDPTLQFYHCSRFWSGTHEAFRVLCHALAKNTVVVGLNLKGCSVGDDGVVALVEAVESNASTLSVIIQETLLTTTSERQGRAIDKDAGGAGMEKKKQEGYF